MGLPSVSDGFYNDITFQKFWVYSLYF